MFVRVVEWWVRNENNVMFHLRELVNGSPISPFERFDQSKMERFCSGLCTILSK